MDANAFLAMLSAFTLRSVRQPALEAYTWNPLPVAQPTRVSLPVKRKVSSLGIDVAATAAVVMDADTGAVLFEKNAEEAIPVASLTKLIAAMTYLDLRPDLSQTIDIELADAPSVGKAVLPLKERFSSVEIFEALLVGSVNESAKALARSTVGTEAFVARMNEKAASLGMRTARFVDASGENAKNVASAKDVALALRAASGYSEIREAMAKPSVMLHGTQKSYLIKTTNLLLSSELNREPYKIVAAKTGTLPNAGHCFAQMTEGEDGQRLIAVLLGGETHFSRFQDVKALTYWAFDAYEWPHQEARAASR